MGLYFEWYDGYHFENKTSIYNPKSVVQASLSGVYDTYWNKTETFEALRAYIDMNFDGLKDDVLTLLIHLGYLGYDFSHECVIEPCEKYDVRWSKFDHLILSYI